MRRWTVSAALLTLLLSGLVVPHASGQGDSTVEAIQTQIADLEATLTAMAGPPTATPDPFASPTVPLTRVVRTDGWRITVTEVRRVSDLAEEAAVPPARGQHLVLALVIENIGEEPVAFPLTDLRIQDDRGLHFSLAWDATVAVLANELDSSIARVFEPRVPAQFVAVFDIPEDAGGLVLTTYDRAFRLSLVGISP